MNNAQHAELAINTSIIRGHTVQLTVPAEIEAAIEAASSTGENESGGSVLYRGTERGYRWSVRVHRG